MTISEWSYSHGLVGTFDALAILARAGVRKRCLFVVEAWRRQQKPGPKTDAIVDQFLGSSGSDDDVFSLVTSLINDPGRFPRQLQLMLGWAIGSVDDLVVFDHHNHKSWLDSCASMREVIGRLTTSMVEEGTLTLFGRAGGGGLRRMAKAAYSTGDYSSLPVMADMLQDAGFNDHYALSHLRGRVVCNFCDGDGNLRVIAVDSLSTRSNDPPVRPCSMCDGKGYLEGPSYEIRHCRGCWVLDFLLGLAPRHLYAPIPDRVSQAK